MSAEKTIVITGVSTGIGLATAKLLLEKGYRVIGSVRQEKDAAHLKTLYPQRFQPLTFDVTDLEAVQKAAEEVEKRVGKSGISALINNAGIAVAGPLQFLPIGDFKYQFEVNVFAVLSVTQAFLPLLGAHPNASHPPGKIINISSVSGTFTPPFIGPYCSSKFALESLSDALRRELWIYGIDVVVLQPGPIQTPIWKKAREGDYDFQNTPYAKIFDQLDKLVRKAEKRALPVEAISERIYSVLQSSKPKTRYLITRTNWTSWLISKLPDRWVDYFIKKGMNKVMK